MIARAATVALWLALPGVCLAAQITGEPIRWMPGSAPCDGVCELDWSLDHLVDSGAIPAVVAARIRAGGLPLKQVAIRDGELLRGMTWAIRGQPRFGADTYRADTKGAILLADAYQVQVGATVYEVLKVRLCQNWTSRSRPAPVLRRPTIAPPIVKADPLPGMRQLVGLASWSGDGSVFVQPYGLTPETPDAPAPIPLPGAIWSLLAGLVGLFSIRSL